MKWFTFLLLSLFSFAATAQDYSNRPIRVIVPYAAGGLPDTMARLVGAKMGEALGQQMVVENRGGAGGIVGTTEVVKAAPDGYVLLVADVGQIAINPHLFAKLPYDPLKDLVGVSLMGTSALYLVAHSSVPALLGGQVALLYAALPTVEGHYKTGKVKILAVSTPQRSPQTPDVPTVAESGVPGYDFVAEIAIYAPAGTPQDVVAKLSTQAARAVKQPDVMQRFKQLGIDAVGSTPEALAAQNRANYEKYARVVKASGAKID